LQQINACPKFPVSFASARILLCLVQDLVRVATRQFKFFNTRRTTRAITTDHSLDATIVSAFLQQFVGWELSVCHTFFSAFFPSSTAPGQGPGAGGALLHVSLMMQVDGILHLMTLRSRRIQFTNANLALHNSGIVTTASQVQPI
jgi:hypothetical protein